MRPAGWKLFGHAMFELSQLNVTEVAKFVQRNFQNLFTKAAPPGKQILYKEPPGFFVRRPKSKNSSPAAEESRKRSAQSLTIQSAPACWSSASLAVVRNARTRAPAALPARTPAGASSITRHSLAGTPRICAPFW